MRYSSILLGVFVLTLWACEPQHEPTIRAIAAPQGLFAEPFLHTSAGGTTYLSWISHKLDTIYSLNFATLEGGSWSTPKRISDGTDWFVNWADFPSVVTNGLEDQRIAAHWLAMRSDGTYDYDIQISQSADGGLTWSEPFLPHTDGIAAEHGFVSMAPLPDDRILATWLDGRYTKSSETPDSDGHSHGAGAMTLRTATFDQEGQLADEAQLDSRVCDCCQTSVAMTSQGPIVAYRDRSEREIRDIAVVRKIGDTWSEPRIVHEDGWQIMGCPVNGPVVRAQGHQVALAWFGIRDSIPEVKVVFSEDDGAQWLRPLRVDDGDPMGRVDLQFIDNGRVVVIWLEKTDEGGVLRGRVVHVDGNMKPAFDISAMSLSRRSGFPRLTRQKEQLIVAWTETEPTLHLKTSLILF